MAKRRRQDSSRAVWLDMNSSNGIGAILVQMPPGERKSVIPHSVEMPAPVNGTIASEPATSSRSRSSAVCKSGAIIDQSRIFGSDSRRRHYESAYRVGHFKLNCPDVLNCIRGVTGVAELRCPELRSLVLCARMPQGRHGGRPN